MFCRSSLGDPPFCSPLKTYQSMLFRSKVPLWLAPCFRQTQSIYCPHSTFAFAQKMPKLLLKQPLFLLFPDPSPPGPCKMPSTETSPMHRPIVLHQLYWHFPLALRCRRALTSPQLPQAIYQYQNITTLAPL